MATWRLTLCVYVCASLCVSEARVVDFPPTMNRTIHSLLKHYKPTHAMFNGKSVFPHPTELNMLLMSGVLQTYDTLIGHMLDQMPTSSPEEQPSASAVTSKDVASGSSSVRNDLIYIRDKIQELKKANFKEQENLLQRLRDLGQIQMDDAVIQSKALQELPRLYQEASQLSNNVMMRRRRRRSRQTKGRKHPEA